MSSQGIHLQQAAHVLVHEERGAAVGRWVEEGDSGEDLVCSTVDVSDRSLKHTGPKPPGE